MAAHFEKVFVQHCAVQDSMREIIARDLPTDLMPSADIIEVHLFAIEYWHQNGQLAPSPEVLTVHFENLLAEHEIDLLIDPEGGLEWCLEYAQNAYIDRQWQPWVRDWTMKISSPDVDPLGKVDAFEGAIDHLMSIQGRFTKRSEHIELTAHGASMIDRYYERASSGAFTGIHPGAAVLGIADASRSTERHLDPQFSIDMTFGGTRPGELTVVAGPPKSGKSFLELNGAARTWMLGGEPVIMTLENDVEMTFDRYVCMMAGVDPTRWERGQCIDSEIARIERLKDEFGLRTRKFHVLQPEPGKRTVEHMVRRAKSLGDSLFVDQLTFVEPGRGSDRKQRWQQIGDLLHELKALISSGDRIPCVLAHQINREGVKAAEREGCLQMYHLAESAEVERTADRVFGLWQSAANRDIGTAWLQMLAARRSALTNWEILWRPHIGEIAMLREIDLEDLVAERGS